MILVNVLTRCLAHSMPFNPLDTVLLDQTTSPQPQQRVTPEVSNVSESTREPIRAGIVPKSSWKEVADHRISSRSPRTVKQAHGQ